MSTETKTETGALTKAGPYGVELEKDKEYFYCTCGLSQSQPFCDGSHKGTAFKPTRFVAAETKTHWICGCREAGGVFCNGTHRSEQGVKKYNVFLLKENSLLKTAAAREGRAASMWRSLSAVFGIALVAAIVANYRR